MIIIYDSLYGNTEKVALALRKGMRRKSFRVEVTRTSSVNVNKLNKYDLLAFGAPTHGFSISKPMKELLGRLHVERLQARRAFAFDTKSNRKWTGSAGKRIEKRLRSLGMLIVKPYQSAAVMGTKGPLVEGAEQAFKLIGREISEIINDF